jgi:hypothetical protein
VAWSDGDRKRSIESIVGTVSPEPSSLSNPHDAPTLVSVESSSLALLLECVVSYQ